MQKKALPEWEQVLSSAARLQQILPDATLVGGTAASLHVHHRVSHDADHTLDDLRSRFDEILASLESVAGWRTARINRPVLILGSLDGIETGIRQLKRSQPLETTTLDVQGQRITIPTLEEILRIKAYLILIRNATRDYLDFVALADAIGQVKSLTALHSLDSLYPQENGESPLMQLQIQLSSPMPFDLSNTKLQEYKGLDPKWHDWNRVKAVCVSFASQLFDSIAE